MQPAPRRERLGAFEVSNNNNCLVIKVQQQQQQQQQSFYTNAQCSHQCQGFHATRGNTPTSWGGITSSTKYPNDSSRPPKPSFPPYDVGTLHFVACGRPWLLFRAPRPTTTTATTTTTRRRAHVARMVFFARDCGPWQARERRAEREKVARASSCNRNVEKPLVF